MPRNSFTVGNIRDSRSSEVQSKDFLFAYDTTLMEEYGERERGDRRMPVFGKLNDRGVESYEVEEGMSK